MKKYEIILVVIIAALEDIIWFFSKIVSIKEAKKVKSNRVKIIIK
jgi:hypothetical protein